jgi:magnesium transporter
VLIDARPSARRISAVAALSVAPTLVAGMHGMTVDHLPEPHWALGYPFALNLMLGLLVRRFKKSGWL